MNDVSFRHLVCDHARLAGIGLSASSHTRKEPRVWGGGRWLAAGLVAAAPFH